MLRIETNESQTRQASLNESLGRIFVAPHPRPKWDLWNISPLFFPAFFPGCFRDASGMLEVSLRFLKHFLHVIIDSMMILSGFLGIFGGFSGGLIEILVGFSWDSYGFFRDSFEILGDS